MYIELASPKPSELFCPDGHPFLSSFALFFLFRLLLCYSNHSAPIDSLLTPTQPYTTTYLCLVCCYYVTNISPSRGLVRVGIYHTMPAVLTVQKNRLFPRQQFSGLFRCCLIAGFSLCQWFAYLPVSPLHVPRRLWKVAESNRLLILSSSWITAEG